MGSKLRLPEARDGFAKTVCFDEGDAFAYFLPSHENGRFR